ncbi:MAG: Hsp33 family molecular chaperone HslO [Gammaproteobacteria bacterium]|nr:Hsp33 family molecular chaperone HslO [Gammaproteobacteria bacterium]PCH62050.1 MAG: Hsp33 family molecular chaperone HslO [Gammaproteobacteria bacterium]
MASDSIRRFLFEKLGIRGEIVRLKHSYKTVLERHSYPPELAQLLGQAMAAVSLLGATIKYQGKLTLQVQGSGPVNLLIVEYDSQRQIRGIINWKEDSLLDMEIGKLFGDGHMAITVNPHDKASQYQGIVELVEPSLAGCIEHYFKQSEQLATCLWLVVDANCVAGFMLQQMPGTTEESDDWQRVKLLAETLSDDELLTLDDEALLHRLFHDDDILLFESEAIRFHCSCSRERIERMLLGLGKDEVDSIIQEQGNIDVACEYCNKNYSFDSVDAMQLFTDGDVGLHSDTRH